MGECELDLDYWRQLFATTETDVWTVITNAIKVAATDYPQELRRQRDAIVESLFAATSAITDKEDLPSSTGDADVGVHAPSLPERRPSSEFGPGDELEREAAVLSEVDREKETVRKVKKLKELLAGGRQGEGDLLRTLDQLETMQISVEVLKHTEIGRTVNDLRKHSSKAVSGTARRLVRTWKELVDDWVRTAEVFGGSEDEHSGALPVPPMDQADLLAARSASVEMNQLLQDFMNDENPLSADDLMLDEDFGHPSPSEGGPKSRGGQTNGHSNGVEVKSNKKPGDSDKKTSLSNAKTSPKERGGERQGTPVGSRSLTPAPRSRGTPPPSNRGLTPPPREVSPSPLGRDRQETPPPRLPPVEAAAKLAESKRKLREGYMEHEHAKKSRTIQEVKVEDMKPAKRKGVTGPAASGPAKSRPAAGKSGQLSLREKLAKKLRR